MIYDESPPTVHDSGIAERSLLLFFTELARSLPKNSAWLLCLKKNIIGLLTAHNSNEAMQTRYLHCYSDTTNGGIIGLVRSNRPGRHLG